MLPWTGVVLAPLAPGGDQMASRFSTYLHPLAGRPLCWHVLFALTQAETPPVELLLVGGAELTPEPFSDLSLRPRAVTWADSLHTALEDRAAPTGTLLVDGALVAASPRLAELIQAGRPRVAVTPEGEPVAVWLPPSDHDLLRDAPSLEAVARACADADPLLCPDAVLVRSRAALGRATAMVRDRLVRRLQDGGVTVMLPDSVLVDVDVRVGRDTVLYPGVILEGQTSIGEETVVGPGCRIIDSWIGSGVELKGWNFIAHTSVRNRAVLEPYVRRGFD